MAESVTITLPKLGFDMQQGTLIHWCKAEGEAVMKGDMLVKVETDKATIEIEAPYSGVVARHLVEKGAVVPVGAAIAIVIKTGESNG